LNHTSGVRDEWQLLGISGTRLDDVITQDQIIKILSKQQALNFRPGKEYSYSNSGFTLLAEIVKSVSGKSLRKFTDSAIFQPLGMNSTHFHDDYTEIVKNRSYSYLRTGKTQFINSIMNLSTVGATSLFTNIDDMSKWIMNFYDVKVGDKKDIDQLTQKARLNSGEELPYALGIMVDNYKGWKQYSHGGSDAGYRTFVSIIPELKLGFIVFSNLGDFNPQQAANNLADLLLPPPPPSHTPPPVHTDTTLAELTDTQSVRKFLGEYISDDNVRFGFRIMNKKLCLTNQRSATMLIKSTNNTFEVFGRPDNKFVFSVNTKGEKVVDQYWPGRTRHLVEFDPTPAPKPDEILSSYTGNFYCPELDCSYRIVLKDHHLTLTHARYNDIPLTLYGEDRLTNDSWWMYNIMVIRDDKKRITGFEVNSGRVIHLWFKKVD
ncbi:MAG TPA: serine hydrolase domain-containing protein, partial [Puia sp.]